MRRQRWAAPCGFVVALLGAWTAHTLEFLRVNGISNAGVLAPSPFGSVHAYMLPIAVALLAAATASGGWLWRTWWALARRADAGQRALTRLWRNRTSNNDLTVDYNAVPGKPARLLSIWLPLLFSQVLIYFTQENVESWASHRPALGLGVFTGVHWAALLIHLGVAFVLAVGVLVATRPLRRAEQALRAVACLLHALTRRLWSDESPAIVSQHIEGIAELLGSALWQRPPPFAAI